MSNESESSFIGSSSSQEEMLITTNINVTLRTQIKPIFDNQEIRTIFIILYSIVFFFCFFGNLVVVLVTTCHWKMRSVTKFCLCNLAIANLCVGIFCIFQNLSLFLVNRWIFGEILCKMYHFINSLSHTASILILVVISVERYFVIIHPLKCRRILTIRRLRLVIAGVWVLSAALSAPRLYFMVLLQHGLQMIDGRVIKLQVICVPLASAYDFKTAETIQFILLFLLPLGIISTLYTRVVLYLRDRDSPFLPRTNRSKRRRSTCCYSCLGKDERRTRDNNPISGTIRTVSTEIRLVDLARSSSSSVRTRTAGPVCTCSLRPEDELESTSLNGDFSSLSRKNRLSVRYNNISSVRINYPHLGGSHTRCYGQACCRTRIASIYRPYKIVNRLLVSVVISFAVFNLPFHLRKLYQNYAPNPDYTSQLSELATPITFLMMYANCALNPFLYGLLSRNFYFCFLDLVKCRLRKPVQSSTASSQQSNVRRLCI